MRAAFSPEILHAGEVKGLKIKSFGYLDVAPRTGVDRCSLSAFINRHLQLGQHGHLVELQTGHHTDLPLLASAVTALYGGGCPLGYPIVTC